MAGTKMQLLIAALLLAASTLAHAQNCGCEQGLCCNNFGYCGTGQPYCGDGCQSGPCYNRTPSSDGFYVDDVVSQKFFDIIIGQADPGCEGKGFYTRWAFLDAFFDAVKQKYFSFDPDATVDDSKREIAAFFAHATHETRYFCHIEEMNKSIFFCDTSYPQYPCAPGKNYYGRGPLQISWNFNYGPAGQDIGFDSLNSPEVVSIDAVLSFKTAYGFG